MNLESTVMSDMPDTNETKEYPKIASNDNKPQTMESLVEEFARKINYEFVSHEKLRKTYSLKIDEREWEAFLRHAVEFQYKAKAPKGFKTTNDDGSCNITDKQRETIADGVVSENYKFKEALLESVFGAVFKLIKDGNEKDVSGYSATLISENEDFRQYTLEFDEIQDLEVIDFSKIHVEKYESEVSEEDIEREIKSILEMQAHIVKCEDQSGKVEENGIANIDFKGYVGKKAFKGGAAKDFVVDLCEKKMLPDFEAGIVGMKVGEIKKIKVKFPKDYNVKAFAGMSATFHVKLNTLLENKKFDSIEEFAAQSEFKTLEQLKEVIRNELNFNMENLLWSLQKNHLIQKLDESVKVEIPELVVERQFENEQIAYADSRKEELQKIQKINSNEEREEVVTKLTVEMEADLKEMRKAIESRVKTSIIMTDIARKNNLELSKEDKSEECVRQARINKIPLDKFIARLNGENSRELVNLIVGNAFERMIMKFIIDKCKSDTICMTLDELKKRYKEIFVDSGKKWVL